MRWSQRVKEQRELLAKASGYVKPGGRLVYATCSLLIEENEAGIAAFLAERPEFTAIAAAEMAARRRAWRNSRSLCFTSMAPEIRVSPAAREAAATGFMSPC